MNDGSIVINTELDTSGFSAGSKEMLSALQHLFSQFTALSDKIDSAFKSNGQQSVQGLMAGLKSLQSALAIVQSRFVELGKTGNIGSLEDWKYIETELEGYNQELEILLQNIEAYKDAQAYINGQKAESNNTEKVNNENNAQQRLNETLEQQISLRQQNNAQSDEGGDTFWGKLWSGLKGAFEGIKSVFGSLFKGKGGNSVLGSMLKPLTSFGGMLKRMILRRVMMAIINGVREGMQNLAKYSKGVEANLTTLKSALGQLKNSLATAFAPILSAVTPALATLINYLSQAITMVAQFFSAIGGSTTFVRAKAYTDSYSKSVGGASKATKELERQLAGFDELEILSANKGGGGGGGGGGIDPSEMFETVKVDGAILDLTENLRKAIADGDFQGIGEELGKLFNKGIALIDWSGIGKKIATGLNNAVKLVNGFLITADFEALGKGLMQFINSGISTFDFRTLGSAISGVIKSALDFVAGLTDEGGISTLVSNLFNAVIEFIKGFDLSGILSAIGTILTNIITDLPNIILAILQGAGNLFLAVSQAIFKAIFTVPDGYFIDLSTFESEIETLFSDIETSAQTHMDNIETIMGDAQMARDYVAVLDELNEKEELSAKDKAEMDRIIALLNSKYPDLNLELDEETGHLNMTNDELLDYIDSQEKIMLLEATRARQTQLITEITDIYKEQKDVAELLDGAEKKLADQNDLLQTYRDIYKISEQVRSKEDELANQFRISKADAEKYKPILDDLHIAYTEVNGELVIADSELGTLQDRITTQETIVANATTEVNTYKTTLGQLETKAGDLEKEYDELNGIIKEGGNVVDYYKGKIKEAGSGVQGFVNEAKKVKSSDIGENIVKGISSGIDAKQSELLNKVKNLTNKIKKDIQKGLQINSPSRVMRDDVGRWIPLGIAEGIDDTTPKALKTVSNLADSIAEEIDNETYSAQILPEAQMTGFADTIVDGFIALGDRLQAIAERIAYQMPSVANGLMPYSVGSSSSSSIYDDKYIRQVVMDASQQIVSAINNNRNVNVTLDKEAMTDTIVEQINRRTRQMNASQLVG